MDFSTEELAIIAFLLDADEEKEDQAHRKYWVHPAWKKRETEGEFQTLYKELLDDETKFHGYFRMSMNLEYSTEESRQNLKMLTIQF